VNRLLAVLLISSVLVPAQRGRQDAAGAQRSQRLLAPGPRACDTNFTAHASWLCSSGQVCLGNAFAIQGALSGGDLVYFQEYSNGGTLTRDPRTGCIYAVYGAIRDHWRALTSENGSASAIALTGWALNDEATYAGARYNDFSNGWTVDWKPVTGAWSIHGDIRSKWTTLGYENSYLGIPVTDEICGPDNCRTRYNYFEKGLITWRVIAGNDALSRSRDIRLSPSPPFNQVRQKNSHNSYQTSVHPESLFDQLVYHRIRALELDPQRSLNGRAAPANDWWVFHQDNFPSDTSTHCPLLSGCLIDLERFHNLDRNHEVVTIWLDMKQNFDIPTGNHSPDALDSLINRWLGNAVYKASDLLVGCYGAAAPNHTIREALQNPNCGWPTVDALKGKFIFIVDALNTPAYGQQAPWMRTAFASKSVSSAAEVEDPANNWAAVFNMDGSNSIAVRDAGWEAWYQNALSREFQSGGSEGWLNGWNSHVQILGTDSISGSTLAPRLSNVYGYPFSYFQPPLTGDSSVIVPTGNFVSVQVNNPRWPDWANRTQDNFYFLYDHYSGGNGLTSGIATPGNTGNLGAACLMLRRDLSPSSPFVAVCRSSIDYIGGDFWGAQVYFRDAPGQILNSSIPVNYWEDDYLSLGVRPAPDCPGVVVDLYVTDEGALWGQPVVSHCSPVTLDFQGIAASSDGLGTLIFRFDNLRHQGAIKNARICNPPGTGQLVSCWANAQDIGPFFAPGIAYDGIGYAGPQDP